MTDPNYLWLAGFAVLIGASLLTKNKIKQVLVYVLVAYASVFVFNNLWITTHSPSKINKGATTDADRADIMLKFESICNFYQKQTGLATFGEIRAKTLAEAEELLKKNTKSVTDDPIMLTKAIIVARESGHSYAPYKARLAAMNTDQSKPLVSVLDELYENPKSLTEEKRKDLEISIKKNLPEGWYQTVSLMRLYCETKQTAALKQITAKFDEKNLAYSARIVLLLSSFGLALLAGVIVVLAQLFLLPRRVSPPEHAQQVASPQSYGFLTIYSVLIGWIATQQVSGILIQTVLKDARLLRHGSLIAAIATLSLYLIQNGPGLLWVYYLALKPRGIKFLEGIRLRFKVDRNGPFKLILFGFFTWLAAIPCVLICALVAAKYLGSNGSSNPVISIVMQAARAQDVAAILIFYATLGIAAPVCEEILFRGFLYTALRKYWGILPSMILSAALFAGVHLDGGGFFPLMTLGLLFAFVTERTRSILPAMVAHGLWNSGTFTMVLLVFSP